MLLDALGNPSSVTAAYSTRRLSTTYSGPLFRLRRDSDASETDIYEGLQSSYHTSSRARLAAWQGSANVYVTTWYDQGGRQNNATNSTTSQQPQLVVPSTPNTPLNILGNPSTITAAYSTRRLGSYAGPLFRLRRSSDNAEDDFFVSGASYANATSYPLETWLGGAIPYVKTWYDQGGRQNNATNSNTAQQPWLVSNATWTTTPAVKFNSAQALPFDGTRLGGNAYTVFVSTGRTSNKSENYIFGGTTPSTNESLHAGWRSNTVFTHDQFLSNYDMAVAGYASPVQTAAVVRHSPTLGKNTYINGLLANTSTNTTGLITYAGATLGRLGVPANGFLYYTGDITEFIATETYVADSSRAAVEQSMITYANPWPVSPVVRFANDSLSYDATRLGGNSYTVFLTAARSSNADFNYIFGRTTSDGSDTGLHGGWRFSNTFTHSQITNAYNMTVPSYTVPQPTIVTLRHNSLRAKNTYLNGTLLGNSSSTVALTTNPNALLGQGFGGSFYGDLSEFVMLEDYVSDVLRAAVEARMTSYVTPVAPLTSAASSPQTALSPYYYAPKLAPLDILQNPLTVTAAYSTRRLGSYQGPIVRLRRPTDNVEDDFFVTSGGAYVSSSELAVDTWSAQTPLSILGNSTSVTAAYSTRRLGSYNGPLFRLRRSTDNVEDDFYAVAGDVAHSTLQTYANATSVTLGTWVGAGIAYVKTWYDQGGRQNNATQSNTAAQPWLVANASWTSSPTLKFANAQSLAYDGTRLGGNAYTVFASATPSTNELRNYFMGGTSTANNSNLNIGWTLATYPNGGFRHSVGGAGLDNPVAFPGNIVTVVTARHSPTGKSTLLNGTLVASNVSWTSNLITYTGAYLGGVTTSASFPFTGDISEFVALETYVPDRTRASVEASMIGYVTTTAFSDTIPRVVRWYDQGGRQNNALQSNLAAQPSFVFSNIPTGPLTLLGNVSTITAAYSTRRLGSYNGPLFRLRRSSDNVEDDFYVSNTTYASSSATPLTTWLVQTPLSILANVSSTVTAAYSTRRLGSYTGPIFRLRRSTDNVEDDFYAVQSGTHAANTTYANATSVTLATWRGAGTAYVTTWYDQGGRGNNATTANTDAQPVLVSNASWTTAPTLRFNNNRMDYNGTRLGGNSYSVFVTAARSSSRTNQFIFGAQSATNNLHLAWTTSTVFRHGHIGTDDYEVTVPAYTSPIATIACARHNRASGKNLYTNGAFLGQSTNANLASYVNAYLGGITEAGVWAGDKFFFGDISEFIVLETYVPDTTRAAVEASMMGYVSTTTFVPAAVPFVTKWYDQGGRGNHASNSNTARQPWLALNSTWSSAPTLRFNNAQQLYFDGRRLAGNAYTVMAFVARSNAKAYNFIFGGSGQATNDNLHVGWRSNTAFTHAQADARFDYDMTVAAYTTPLLTALTVRHSPTLGKNTYVNGTLLGSSANTASLATNEGMYLGGLRYPDGNPPWAPDGLQYVGDISEFIALETYVPDNTRSAIEGSMMAYALNSASWPLAPTIRFGGSHFLQYDGSRLAGNAYTIFASVARSANVASNYFLGGNSAVANTNLRVGWDYDTAYHAYYGNAAETNWPVAGNAFKFQSGTLMTLTHSSVSGKAVYVNGALAGSNAAYTTSLASYAGAMLGSRTAANTAYFNGDMTEFVAVEATVPDPARSNVESSMLTYAQQTSTRPLVLLKNPTTCTAAFSTRLLGGYSGPVFRLRRSSDNVEDDFYVSANTYANATSVSLTTWQGSSSNVFVTTWYDQGGRQNNATNATTSQQPYLVSNAGWTTVPTLRFSGAQKLDYNGTRLGGNAYTVFCNVARSAVSEGHYFMGGTSTTTNTNLHAGWAYNDTFRHALYTTNMDANVAPYTPPQQGTLATLLHSPTIGKFTYLNGILVASNAAYTANLTTYNGARIGGMLFSFTGDISEFMAFEEYFVDADRAAVENALLQTFATQPFVIPKTVRMNTVRFTSRGLLDNLDNATRAQCTVAYAAQALWSGYTGPVVRVRRSTDNAEADFYAVGTYTLLTTATNGATAAAASGASYTTLENWLGSATASVIQLYDQTGSGKHSTAVTGNVVPTLTKTNSTGNNPGRGWQLSFADGYYTLPANVFANYSTLTAVINGALSYPGGAADSHYLYAMANGRNWSFGSSKICIGRGADASTKLFVCRNGLSFNTISTTDLGRATARQWTMRANAQNIAVFVNGTQESTITATVPSYATNDVIALGGSGSTNRNMLGELNSFMVFQAELASATLTSLL